MTFLRRRMTEDMQVRNLALNTQTSYVQQVSLFARLDIADGEITFRYKDYRHDDHQKTMTLNSEEFIRRFLLHVLPDGFQRIRYYGLLGNRYREEKLARCRQLLGMPACTPPASEATKDYLDRYEELTGSSLNECPVCHQGRMARIAVLLPRPNCQTPITDTS